MIVVPTSETDDHPQGPVCPECREPLLGNLKTGRLDAEESSNSEVPTRVAVVYCGSCGLSLHIEPVRLGQTAARVPIVERDDPATLDGLFQLRCRDLVTQIREMGFEPHVWVDMINDLGATDAAKRILEANLPLVATHWLVGQDRSDLTLEHEIMEVRWADLFDDDERAEADRRLSTARGTRA
jgi:hypothetical protein